MADITLIFDSEDDWVGVYKNGYLAYAGRSIPPDALLRLCEAPFHQRYVEGAEEDGLPVMLSQVR